MSDAGNSHGLLCSLALRLVRSSKRCRASVSGLVPSFGESPDVWGIRRRGSRLESYLVEVKVSRSDFRADAGKVFRRYGDQVLGTTVGTVVRPV